MSETSAVPESVAKAWEAFASIVDVTSVQDGDWDRLASVVVALYEADLGYPAIEDGLIDLSNREGAPEFLSGELVAGIDVGLKVLSKGDAERKRAAALAKLSPEERAALGL
jgi:hypothetical protein